MRRTFLEKVIGQLRDSGHSVEDLRVGQSWRIDGIDIQVEFVPESHVTYELLGRVERIDQKGAFDAADVALHITGTLCEVREELGPRMSITVEPNGPAFHAWGLTQEQVERFMDLAGQMGLR